ncbi:hypothetical protein [Mesobacillus subterraneus]|uniref:Uncharacterized protein n=1 Tax=Mesobacillus subterraneus TaxID=285983 RepID=A0A3R9FXV8_9BACI|nr:hypothetical protein [Mesobacillus subterraneus]RSD27632.1 hypothetical protein EJA10_07565 [Mesobacillus subterraneus]
MKMYEIKSRINELFKGDKIPTQNEFNILLKEIDPKVQLAMIDIETGAIFKSEMHAIENIYIKEAVKYFKTKKHAQEKKKKTRKGSGIKSQQPKFIACRNIEIEKIIDKIKIEDARILMYLLSCLTMESKGKVVDERGVPLSFGKIMEGLDISSTTLKGAIKRLKELGIIESKKNENNKRETHYIINRRFHSMNKSVNESFTKLIKKRLKEVVKDKRTGNAIGALYKLLTKVHYQTGYICWNPDHDIRKPGVENLMDCLDDEYTIKAIDHMTQKEMALVVGVTPKTMNIYVGLYEELCIMKRDVMGDSVLHIVDPTFILRVDWEKDDGSSLYTKVLSFQFEQHKKTKNGFRKKSNRGRKKKEN